MLDSREKMSSMKTRPSLSKCEGEDGTCLSRGTRFRSYEEIVQDYIDRYRRRAKKELKFYARQPDLASAVRLAALAITRRGRRHPHQYRIPGDYLEHFRKGIWRRREAVRSCTKFPALMKVCEDAAAQIWKQAGLAVYDAAHRIGAYCRVEPDRVYLHAGTRVGARALGFKGNISYIFRRDLPKAFGRLRPYEIEDCLCIYKDELKLLAQTS